MRWKPSGTIKRLYAYIKNRGSPGKRDRLGFFVAVPAPPRGRGAGTPLMGRSVGRGLDPSAGVCGRHRVCPPPRGRGRACPARGFSRGWAVAGGFRGVGDAAPYVGGCPLTGGRANLRRGAGTPPYGCNSCNRGRCGHSLMGRSVGRGLDPSVGVYGQHGACPPPRGRGRACPARGFSRGWAVMGGFRGVGDAAPYAGGLPVDVVAARTCGGVRAPRPTAVGAAYMPPASLCGMPFAGCCFSFNIGLAIRLKMYPRCRAWTFDNRLYPALFSVRLHLCF